jgi:hypothetical protein
LAIWELLEKKILNNVKIEFEIRKVHDENGHVEDFWSEENLWKNMDGNSYQIMPFEMYCGLTRSRDFDISDRKKFDLVHYCLGAHLCHIEDREYPCEKCNPERTEYTLSDFPEEWHRYSIHRSWKNSDEKDEFGDSIQTTEIFIYLVLGGKSQYVARVKGVEYVE